MRFTKLIVTCAVLWVALVASVPGAGAQAHQPEPAKQGAAGRHAAETQHEEGLMPTVARIANFVILVGLLTYFLRTPFAGYLQSRGQSIRAELVEAAAMRRDAKAQLVEIDRRMQVLPGELAELRRRGADDIAAEEARIRAATDAERERLLEHMHRDVEMQVRIARRDLMAEAAALATEVARRRIETTITAEDQSRLLDRYTNQLEGAR